MFFLNAIICIIGSILLSINHLLAKWGIINNKLSVFLYHYIDPYFIFFLFGLFLVFLFLDYTVYRPSNTFRRS